MQKHSFQGGSGSVVFNAVRAGAYWHTICGIYVYAFAEQNFQTGEHGQFDHFAKAIERQNGQKMAEFEGERQKGQKRQPTQKLTPI